MEGQRFGQWTVLDNFIMTDRGERKWLCRCSCGTERHVVERSLRSGSSTSCGCQRKMESGKSRGRDLRGMVFGELTVLDKSETPHKNGGTWWRCLCACGSEYEVPGTLLATGKRTHCGSRIHERKYRTVDISGKRFSSLVALYPTDQRDSRGFVIWHCRCDCGNTVDVSYNALLYTNVKSCGCRKKAHCQNLGDYLTYTDGTSIDMIRSKKVPTNNTTGHKGVYFIKGKYVAKIVFQKKAYYLGVYEEIQDAVQARKEAEEILFDGVSAYYDEFNAAARWDPVWAEANPVRIEVSQDEEKSLTVSIFPQLSDVVAHKGPKEHS